VIRPIVKVVLPAPVVRARSLFGVIGIVAWFVVGLMIRHHRWVTH
jgi:hypothetical protein